MVAFFSGEPDLVPGDTNDADDVFIRDRKSGRTELVSVARTRILTTGALRPRPKRPRAGGELTITLRVTLEGEPVVNARVTCAARARGRALAPVARGFIGSTARCAWRIPRTAGGAVIRGSISAASPPNKVTKSFAVRVR